MSAAMTMTATNIAGEPALRATGSIFAASLEASVDLGAEYAATVVMERAYSAAKRIGSAADLMLLELMRFAR